jgi:hypothetical protein
MSHGPARGRLTELVRTYGGLLACRVSAGLKQIYAWVHHHKLLPSGSESQRIEALARFGLKIVLEGVWGSEHFVIVVPQNRSLSNMGIPE